MQDQHRALLLNALQVPLVMRDIIDISTPLKDDMIYTLHKVISDLKPTTAFLTIAGAALACLQKDTSKPVSAQVVEAFCESILISFGPEWIRDKDTNPDVLMERLPEIAEDLELLSDYLQVLSIQSNNSLLKTLYGVLQVQAAAQGEIAEEFVSMMVEEENQLEEDFSNLDMDIARYESPLLGQDSNVVDFPASA